MTMTHVDEAVGVVAAARSVGLPVVVMFTVETDGRLPDGTALRRRGRRRPTPPAAQTGSASTAPTPTTSPRAGRRRRRRLGASGCSWCGPNASRLSHAELDEAEELDDGDPVELRGDLDALRDRLPGLRVVGGCCGTDVRHVASLWGV